MTGKLNQQQVDEVLRTWPMRIEAKPTTEEYERFRPLRDEWERLNAIPEVQRTVWQREAHAVLLAELITTYDSPWFAWTKPYGQTEAMNAAATHHMKQYQQS